MYAANDDPNWICILFPEVFQYTRTHTWQIFYINVSCDILGSPYKNIQDTHWGCAISVLLL